MWRFFGCSTPRQVGPAGIPAPPPQVHPGQRNAGPLAQRGAAGGPEQWAAERNRLYAGIGVGSNPPTPLLVPSPQSPRNRRISAYSVLSSRTASVSNAPSEPPFSIAPQLDFSRIHQAFVAGHSARPQISRADSSLTLLLDDVARIEERVQQMTRLEAGKGVADLKERAERFLGYIKKAKRDREMGLLANEVEDFYWLLRGEENAPEVVRNALAIFPPNAMELACLAGTRERLRTASRLLISYDLGHGLVNAAIERLANDLCLRQYVRPGNQIHTETTLRFLAGLSSEVSQAIDQFFVTPLHEIDIEKAKIFLRELAPTAQAIFQDQWTELAAAAAELKKAIESGAQRGFSESERRLEQNPIYEACVHQDASLRYTDFCDMVDDAGGDRQQFESDRFLQTVGQWLEDHYGGQATSSDAAGRNQATPTNRESVVTVPSIKAFYENPQASAATLRDLLLAGDPEAINTAFCLCTGLGGSNDYIRELVFQGDFDHDFLEERIALSSSGQQRQQLEVIRSEASAVANRGPIPLDTLQEAIDYGAPLSVFVRLKQEGSALSDIENIWPLYFHPQREQILESLKSSGIKVTDTDTLFRLEQWGEAPLIRQLLGVMAHDRQQVDNEKEEALLFKAASKGAKEVVRALLENGFAADSAHTDIGETPLWIAALNGHTEVVQALLDKGANVNAVAGAADRGTPLWAAAYRGHTEVAKALIEKGADINRVGSQSRTTPLWAAARHGYTEIAKALVQRGANITARDLAGKTPLDIARQQRHREVIKLLEEAELNQSRYPKITKMVHSYHRVRRSIGL